jgi:hypothetical protein
MPDMTVSGGRSRESPISLSMLGWALNEEDNVAEYIERAESFSSLTSDRAHRDDDGSTTARRPSSRSTSRRGRRLHRNAKNRGPGFLQSRHLSRPQGLPLLADGRLVVRHLSTSPAFHHPDGTVTCSGRAPARLSPGFRSRSDTAYKVWCPSRTTCSSADSSGYLHDYQNVTVYPRALSVGDARVESAFTNRSVFKVWWKVREFPAPFSSASGVGKGTRPLFVLRSVADAPVVAPLGGPRPAGRCGPRKDHSQWFLSGLPLVSGSRRRQGSCSATSTGPCFGRRSPARRCGSISPPSPC